MPRYCRSGGKTAIAGGSDSNLWRRGSTGSPHPSATSNRASSGDIRSVWPTTFREISTPSITSANFRVSRT